ncbi:peptidoglycan recognition protein family protein [Flexithrix dorotheae]|uniref:peptidoglycan recognition protein family protein n=1 Tax=Flexithrix dorotheae TaxID=70993 RepID=UPI000367C546|nr:peptidoglycan recognition family protein [Flexithrix dorotheae]
MQKQLLFLITLFYSFQLAHGQIKIVDKPVIFDERRKELSLEYMKTRYDIEKETPTIDPKIIVVHYTVIPTFEKTFQVFDKSEIPQSRDQIKGASQLNVSAQFVVDRDGTIYRLMPETTFARHVIGLNHCAIGIENVGDGKDNPLTKAQLKANAKLVKYLKEKYEIEYLIGHYEYKAFQNHPLWKEKDKNYRTVKDDPGKDFMKALRKKVKKLDINPAPELTN